MQLNPGMTMRQALAAILLTELGTMERNIQGIRDDTDSEFLHDFRVANRRSRSLITAMKHALATPAHERGKQFFSWMSKQTSALRDIDVFLLAFGQHKKLLPEEVYAQLMPLREFLQQRRESERKHLVSALESDRFLQFIHVWRQSLQESMREENTTGPVLETARTAIWRAWERTGKLGRRAARSGSDEALHELRKSAKKLRYLLEAFRTLFPAKAVEQATRQLRQLQNVLGDIVDFQVQQQYLGQWRENFQGEEHRDVKAAMNFLGKVYADRENAKKKKFQRHYDVFVSPENKDLFKSLCGRISG